MEYTQGEWIALQKDLGLGHKGSIILTTQQHIDDNTPWIADCGYTQDSEANARHIVKCVNERNDLVEALLLLSRTSHAISVAHHSGVPVCNEMWSDLHANAIRAKAVLTNAERKV